VTLVGRSLRARLLIASGAIGFVLSLLAACTTPAVKEEKLCVAGQYVFCRCQDRQEGAKQCKADAKSFGPCEPCETFDNPEGPLQPGDPLPNRPFDPDAGRPRNDAGPLPGCGNGVVDDGEDCDDDSDVDGDGCDRHCKLSGPWPPPSNGCPGLPVHVWGGAHKPSLASETPGSGNRSATPPCGTGTATSGATAADRVFQVVAHKTGVMNVVVDVANYNVFLYVSNACATGANTWLKCANENGGAAGESLKFDVESGKTYYVFVDGTGTTAHEGYFHVTFSVE
jgi:cysteine-rich repeat protein